MKIKKRTLFKINTKGLNQSNFYEWNRNNNSLKELPLNSGFLEQTISFYQVADYLYRNNGLKIKA